MSLPPAPPATGPDRPGHSGRPLRRRSRRPRLSPLSRPVAVLAAAVLAVTATACVRGETSDGATEEAEARQHLCPVDAHLDVDGVVEVELWHGLGGESLNALEAMAADFNDSQDKVQVSVRNQGKSFAEVLRKYVAGIPSGQLPAIAYLEGTALRRIVDTETVLPAQVCEEADGIRPDVLPVVRNYYTADDLYWPAYPNVGSTITYYNANHFRQAGLDPADPPETLEELREMARALSEAGIPSPLALILNASFVESWINGAGASVVNNDNGRDGLATESTFDNPTTHEVYTWIQEMAEEGLLEGFSATDGQVDQYLAVAQQNSSLLIETSTAATTIKTVLGGGGDDLSEEAGIDAGEVDLSTIVAAAGPFPGLTEPAQVRLGTSGFFISNRVPEAEQAGAWEFLKFMWEVDNQLTWHLLGGYLPTTEEAATHPDVVEYWADDLAGRMLKVAYDQLVDINPARPGPQLGPDDDYAAAIKNSLDRLVLRGDSVDAVIATAHEEIQAALDRYVEDNGG